jgi:N6-adenosine-specific RNA methylase IME4
MRFTTLSIDCPWRYKSPGWKGGASKHYNTIPVEALTEMPIPDLLEPNAHVWMWATDTFEEAALAMLRKWGLTKRANYPWIKLSPKPLKGAALAKAQAAGDTLVYVGGAFYRLAFGNGFYGRANPEFMILATRGKQNIVLPARTTTRKLVQAPMAEADGYYEGETFYAPAGVHSEKPEAAYEIIRGMSPETRLDVFARPLRAGFATWGREAEGRVAVPALDQWSAWATEKYQAPNKEAA